MPVVVTTAAQTTDLVDLETVKTYLQIAGSDQDAVLASLISQASSSCVGYLQRPLALQEYRERISIRGRRQTAINLSVGPIAAIRSITVDGRAVTFLDEMFVSRDKARLDDPYHAPVTGDWACKARQVEITYLAGFLLPGMDQPEKKDTDLLPLEVTVLPNDIVGGVLGTIQMLRYGQGRDPLLKSESVQGVGSTTWQSMDASVGGISPDAIAALDRLVIAADWMA